MLPNAVRARRPIGIATAPTPLLVWVSIVRSDAPVSTRAPPMTQATSTTMAPPEAIRLRSGSPTSAPIHPPARPSVSKSAMILPGPRTTCSSPSNDSPTQSPADGQTEAAHALALADERDADSDEGDRHHETAEPGEPANHGLDPAPERAGQIDVDGQAEQHAERR